MLSQIAYECHTLQRPFAPPVALITGGHLDVPIAEDATGVGGRNQEFTLLWARELGQGMVASHTALMGQDGPSARLHEHQMMKPK